MKHPLPTIASQLCQIEPHVRTPTLVAIVKRAVSRATPDLLRDRVDQRARLHFHALSVLNIDGHSVPLNEVSSLVAQWRGANQEPAILPVSPPQAHLILGRFLSGHVREPVFHEPWMAFRMNRARRLVDVILERKARVSPPHQLEQITGALR